MNPLKLCHESLRVSEPQVIKLLLLAMRILEQNICFHVSLLKDSSGSILFFPLYHPPSLWSKVEGLCSQYPRIYTIPLEWEVHEGTDHLGLMCQCIPSTQHGA